MVQSRHLGTVLAVFEHVRNTRKGKRLVVRGAGLKANHLSCAAVDLVMGRC